MASIACSTDWCTETMKDSVKRYGSMWQSSRLKMNSQDCKGTWVCTSQLPISNRTLLTTRTHSWMFSQWSNSSRSRSSHHCWILMSSSIVSSIVRTRRRLIMSTMWRICWASNSETACWCWWIWDSWTIERMRSSCRSSRATLSRLLRLWWICENSLY